MTEFATGRHAKKTAAMTQQAFDALMDLHKAAEKAIERGDAAINA